MEPTDDTTPQLSTPPIVIEVEPVSSGLKVKPVRGSMPKLRKKSVRGTRGRKRESSPRVWSPSPAERVVSIGGSSSGSGSDSGISLGDVDDTGSPDGPSAPGLTGLDPFVTFEGAEHFATTMAHDDWLCPPSAMTTVPSHPAARDVSCPAIVDTVASASAPPDESWIPHFVDDDMPCKPSLLDETTWGSVLKNRYTRV